jgi:polyisoprenoid-binding protein YceI
MTTRHYNIDTAHSAVQFSVRHMVIAKVRGAFSRFDAKVAFDEEHPERSSVTARIDAASIDTHEPKRDEHLRSADFLDVANHPHLEFRSTRVEKRGERYRVFGELSIRGVTREVELDAEYLGTGKDPWGNERLAFSARTKVNRKDFGLAWNQVLETGGVLVGEDIEINLDIQGVREQAAERAAE